MEGEILQMIVVNLPNFVFAAVALAGAYRVVMKQFGMIEDMTRRCKCDDVENE